MSKVVDLQKRRYEAASKSTRTKNWYAPSTDANAAIVYPQTIRNRARDLVRNNPWAQKGISVITNNIVGYGIRAQWNARIKREAKRAQDIWKAWAESTQCDAQGLTDFYGIQQTAVRGMVESGESLIRLRTRRAEDGLAIPFQLQVLEPDFLYEYNDGSLPNGGYIQRGIEYDAIGRRVAYYLHKYHPGNAGRFAGNFNETYSRVPAYEVIHLFRIDRPGQERGVSWLAPIIIRLKELDIYEDAYLNRQKIANLFAAFIKSDDPDQKESDLTDSELLPALIYALKYKDDVVFSNPPKADDYGPYTLANLRASAAGLNIPYEAFTGDLSEVNFSSGRMGWQEFGRSVDSWRWQLTIPRLCKGVERWFSDITAIDELNADWTPPARTMVDPGREIPPIIDAMKNGLLPPPEAIRELGFDPEWVAQQYALWNAFLDQYKLSLETDPRGSNNGQQNANTNQTAS